MSHIDIELMRRYEAALKTGEVVFDGKPLSYFAKMRPEELFEYKKCSKEFSDSWVFKALLQVGGPVFYRRAMCGHDMLSEPPQTKYR